MWINLLGDLDTDTRPKCWIWSGFLGQKHRQCGGQKVKLKVREEIWSNYNRGEKPPGVLKSFGFRSQLFARSCVLCTLTWVNSRCRSRPNVWMSEDSFVLHYHGSGGRTTMHGTAAENQPITWRLAKKLLCDEVVATADPLHIVGCCFPKKIGGLGNPPKKSSQISSHV